MKRKVVESSSESDTETQQSTPGGTAETHNDDTRTRSSERIRRRQKAFTMPSREEVFRNIPSLKSPKQDVASLKPLKLINSFTKERSRYNYDDVDSRSDDDDLADFIVDEDSDEGESAGQSDASVTSSGSLQSKVVKKQKLHRIRSVESSESSSDDEENIKTTRRRKRPTLDSSEDEASKHGEGQRSPQRSRGNQTEENDDGHDSEHSDKNRNDRSSILNDGNTQDAPDRNEKVDESRSEISGVSVSKDDDISESDSEDIPVSHNSSRCNRIDSSSSDDEAKSESLNRRLKSPRAELMKSKKDKWRSDVLTAYQLKRKQDNRK